MIGLWCGEGVLEGSGDISCDSVWYEYGVKGGDNWWLFWGEKGYFLTAWDDKIFLDQSDPFLPEYGMFPPIFHVCYSGTWIMRYGKLLMGYFWFLICATHLHCSMIHWYHPTDSQVYPYRLLVVGWVEEVVFQESRVFAEWGAPGCHIGFVFSRCDISPLPLRMYRVEVCSRLLISLVHILVGGSVPEFLGGRVLYMCMSISYRSQQRFHHIRWVQSLCCCDSMDPTCSHRLYRRFYLPGCRIASYFILSLDL